MDDPGSSSPDTTAPHPGARRTPRLPLSAGQVRAIYGAMRTFRDDDRSRIDPEARFRCARCGCSRRRAGSLSYGEQRLCNGCATDYELLRTAGIESEPTAHPRRREPLPPPIEPARRPGPA